MLLLQKKLMKFTFCILLFINLTVFGQQQPTISHFSVWKPKNGKTADFTAGYKQHLIWHTANHDSWNWYGWFIISGPRDGMFIDATFNHSWRDFDLAKNPSGDGADNQLHTEPFADFLKGYKVSLLPFSDPLENGSLQTSYMRMLTIELSDVIAGTTHVSNAAKIFKQKNAAQSLHGFKLIDGGNVNEIVLMIGINNFEEFGITQDLSDELSKGVGNGKSIRNIVSETLVFRKDMSLNID
jgi:hypothetical protein